MSDRRRLSDDEIARARARWDVITADVAMKRRGRELVGLCPMHGEKSPSFAIVADKGFAHCHGCGWHGDAISYLMQTRNLDFIEAVHAINGTVPQQPKQAAPPAPRHDDEDDRRDTAEEIGGILLGCTAITPATAAHLYLWSRGLGTRQPALYAHPALPCWELGRDERGEVRRLPALVAPFIDSGDVIAALLRIWLVDKVVYDGSAKPKDNRAPLRTRKKGIGVMRDGAVRLTPIEQVGSTLGFAEGVETGDAAKRLYRIPVWACGGTARFGFPAHWRAVGTPKGQRPKIWVPPDEPPGGVEVAEVAERPPTIWIPDHVERVLVFGDRGETGEAVANHAADWWSRQGLDAQAVFPEPRFDDFNDQLLGAGR